mgnify:CR=1 FL=1
MNDCMITFRSVTPAQRGEKALHRAGFTCSIQRTPRWMEERGCGYGVEVKCPELGQGLEVLRREKLPFRKSYLLHPDGVAEVITDDLP